MIDLFTELISYFQYDFVRYSFIVGILVSLCASVLGVILILKRFSFMGDGLSHVAFGATAIAAVVGLTERMWLVLPVTILCAIFLLGCSERLRIKGDASIAMISVSAMTVGYLLLHAFAPNANVSEHLFGSTAMLTLSTVDMWLCVILSVVILGVFILFYNRIFAVTFDEDFASATGTRAKVYNLLLAVIIAVVIVLAMNLVGSLLISALIIFPATSAMRLFKSFRSVILCAAVFSVVGAVTGILIALLANSPVGATIVAVDMGIFVLSRIIGAVLRR